MLRGIFGFEHMAVPGGGGGVDGVGGVAWAGAGFRL